MQSQNSAASESRNLSFAEFEWFVDTSCLALDDYQSLFVNQAWAVNRAFAQVGNNDQKCEEMNRQLVFHHQVERITKLNLCITNKLMTAIDKKVARFERGDESAKMNMHDLDPLRRWIYPMTIKVNELLNMHLKKYEARVLNLPEAASGSKRDSEYVERLLDNQLKHMEHLEVLLERFKDSLDGVEHHPLQAVVKNKKPH